MTTDLKTLQAQAEAITDMKSEDAERLKLNIQIEMLRTQERMLNRWASIDTWITIIGVVMLVTFILFLFFFIIPMFG